MAVQVHKQRSSAAKNAKVRSRAVVGEPGAALTEQGGGGLPVCPLHGKLVIQDEKGMSYERAWCIAGGGRWWVCNMPGCRKITVLEPGSESEAFLAQFRNRAGSPTDEADRLEPAKRRSDEGE